jgi:hypothetical protein
MLEGNAHRRRLATTAARTTTAEVLAKRSLAQIAGLPSLLLDGAFGDGPDAVAAALTATVTRPIIVGRH